MPTNQSKNDNINLVIPARAELQEVCPECGLDLTLADGIPHCYRCGLDFEPEIEELE